MKGILLVVDDDPNVRAALGSAFSRDGYEVRVAGSVAEARPLISADLRAAIVDITMPGGSGLTLLELLEEIPCLLLADFPSVPQAVAAIKSGAADYLPKPVDLDRLLQKIAALTGPS